MVTVDGRLVHVDFGWALGKEPLDAMLIHFAVQGRSLLTLMAMLLTSEPRTPKTFKHADTEESSPK